VFEEVTPENIKQQILENTTEMDTREGSFANNIISPTAYKLWEVLQSLNGMIPIAFVDETSGEYIDKRGAEFGIYRKAGTKARATMVFTGSDGVVIPSGSVFLTEDGYEYSIDRDVTIADGTGSGTVTAVEVGESYNTEINTIVLQYKNRNGLTGVTNGTAAVGGTNPESDKAMVNRLYEYWQMPASSGNIYHYKLWAKEVNGVGESKVFPLWAGNGTVKLVIVDSEMHPASADIVAACQNHIDAVRPIGATVIVASATKLDIAINMSLKLDGTKALGEVQEKIRKAIETYIRSIAFKAEILLYNRIAYAVLDTPGVIDFTILTVNGSTANLAIAEGSVAVLARVEVVESVN